MEVYQLCNFFLCKRVYEQTPRYPHFVCEWSLSVCIIALYNLIWITYIMYICTHSTSAVFCMLAMHWGAQLLTPPELLSFDRWFTRKKNGVKNCFKRVSGYLQFSHMLRHCGFVLFYFLKSPLPTVGNMNTVLGFVLHGTVSASLLKNVIYKISRLLTGCSRSRAFSRKPDC